MPVEPGSELRSVYLGTGSRVITPEPGGELCGFIARVKPMQGTHDDLLVKAMVWADDADRSNAAALVTLDVIDVESEFVASVRQQVEEATGIPGERIGVTCTHTHGGPVTMPDRRLGRADFAWIDRAAILAAEVVVEAANSIEPMIFTAGTGNEPTVGKNRRVHGGVIDPDVPVLRFQRANGQVAAILTSYGCHPVTLGPNNFLATADYPGYVRRTLETIYEGAEAHFVTGCCGQVNNGHTSRDGDYNRGMIWRSYGEAERIGRAIAGEALQAAEQSARFAVANAIEDQSVEPATVRVASRTIALPFLRPPEETELLALTTSWEAELRALEMDDAAPGGELARLRVYLDWAAQVQAGPAPESADAEVMAIGVGDVIFALLPGESFVEFGLEIKARANRDHVFTLAYANGRPGYIPHRSAYPAGGYEVDDAYRYYGYPACFAPEAGELVVETALELIAALPDEELS